MVVEADVDELGRTLVVLSTQSIMAGEWNGRLKHGPSNMDNGRASSG